MKNKNSRDETIGKMFDSSYNTDANPALIKNFDESVKFYLDYITNKNVKSVLDVGMGAGGLLLALQGTGISQLYGIELSQEGVNLAKERFDKYGDPTKVEFFQGNFVDFSIDQVDVITFHRVIHCYPDYTELIEKSVEINPKYIIYTIPRDIWTAKLFIGFLSLLSKPITGFRAYVHPTQKIAEMLEERNYQQLHFSTTNFWETRVFGSSDYI